jgi:hypothetical protein
LFPFLKDIEVRRHESLLLVSLVEEVVDSGNLVVFVVVYALLRIVWLEAELLQHFKDGGFDWDLILTDDQALILT